MKLQALVAPLATVALGLLVIGCGSGGSRLGRASETIPRPLNAPPDFTTAPGHAHTATFVQSGLFGTGQQSLRGAFDWQAKRGWASVRTGRFVINLVQIGPTCYEQREGRWGKLPVGPDGFCSGFVFEDPWKVKNSLRAIAHNWHIAGHPVIGGAPTIHYSGFLPVDKIKSPIDVWVDASGAARRKSLGVGRRVVVKDFASFGEPVKFRLTMLMKRRS
jgi:hypothetical protein